MHGRNMHATILFNLPFMSCEFNRNPRCSIQLVGCVTDLSVLIKKPNFFKKERVSLTLFLHCDSESPTRKISSR